MNDKLNGRTMWTGMKLEVLVVDDEPAARELLVTLLGEMEDIGRVRTAATALDALRQVGESPVHLLLLDVEMPGGSGFDLLKALPHAHEHAVIFTTSHPEYALRAIKEHPEEFLLKPIDPDELRAAVKAVRARHPGKEQHRNTLELRTQTETHFVRVEELMHLHGDGAYTHVHLLDGRQLLVSMNLGRLEVQLPQEVFFRCHRSHVVALPYVRSLHHIDGGQLELTNGSRVPLATRKHAEFEARMRR